MNVQRGPMILTVLLSLSAAVGYGATTRPHHTHHRHHRHAKSKVVAKAVVPSKAAQHAQDERDNTHLQLLARRIERDTQALPQDDHVENMANQFHVSLSTVEDLQKQGKSWGEIHIVLTMADYLSKKNAVLYSSPSDAVTAVTIVQMKAKNWRDIARGLKIPLRPIAIAAAQGYTDFLSQHPTQNKASTDIALASPGN